jgi:hypothetical protein
MEMPPFDPSGGMMPGPGMPFPGMIPEDGNIYAGPTVAWGGVEYLLFFPRRGPIRYPLVTTSAPAANGILGNPSTVVELGDQGINYGTMSGIRANVGFWTGLNRRVGIELGGFLMERSVERFAFASDETGYPVIARPYLLTSQTLPSGQVVENIPDSLLIAFPEAMNGGVVVTSALFIWGTELNGVLNLYRAPVAESLVQNVNMIAGLRYFNFEERLQISSRTEVFGAQTFFGGNLQTPDQGQEFVVDVLDDFAIRNQFYGGQLGAQVDLKHKCYTLSLIGKCAAGYQRQIYRLNGVSTQIGSAAGNNFTRSVPGGLFVATSNIGKTDKEEFAILPEGTLRLGVQVCRGINFYTGYSFLWINRVARPGMQIDPVIDPRLVPTNPLFGQPDDPPRPALTRLQDQFFLQGITFGLEMSF